MSAIDATRTVRKADKALRLISGRDIEYLRDSSLQRTINELRRSRDDLKKIDQMIKDVCELPSDPTRSILARILYHLIPKRAYPIMPQGVMKFVAEEYDVLEQIERFMRENVINTQEALRSLAGAAILKQEEIEQLRGDIAEAKQAEWNAQKLQAYIAEHANIPVYDEIAKLLDQEFHGLSEEEKGKRKDELLQRLEANISLGEALIETLGKVCSAGLQVFHQGVAQYGGYVRFYRPISVIRDAAKTMIDTNNSMFAARDALKATLQVSLKAIEVAVDAAKQVKNYSVTSPEMHQLLESGRKSIELKLEVLAENEKKALALVPPAEEAMPAGAAPPNS